MRDFTVDGQGRLFFRGSHVGWMRKDASYDALRDAMERLAPLSALHISEWVQLVEPEQAE